MRRHFLQHARGFAARAPTVMDRMRRLAQILSLFILLLLLLGCSRDRAGSTGALSGLPPLRADGVLDAERMTDGFVPEEGAPWKSDRTAVFRSSSSFVEYDLGSEKEIVALALLADNNDAYRITGSKDGKEFFTVWTAPRVAAVGLRWRHTQSLGGKKARYVRLEPGKGDAALSAAEFSVFTEKPQALPPPVKVVSSVDVALQLRSAILTSGVLLIVAAVFMTGAASLWFNLVLALGALGGLGYAGWAFAEAYPVDKLEVSLTRGVAAGVALLIVLRQAFSPPRFPPVRWFQISALGVLAAVSVFAFFNMGTPQFYDAKYKEPSVVHNYDMRVYFPVAKYFDELKYDGLYLASVASYAEEHGGLDTPQIQRTELRDLRDHRMRRVSAVLDEVRAVKTRFSEARWKEFKEDMRYFWETMGPSQYLGSMRDHGGNATPVWLSIAHLMFRNADASNEVLLWAAALDPLLLLLFGLVVWRTFGPSMAFVSLIVFGANDFYMFGSNWAGATLRNDWMVYLGLGACALQAKRYKLGGALLAGSALIRAFPAISLLALGVPVLHSLVVDMRETGKTPGFKEIWDKHRWFFDTAIGATICVVVCVLGSSLIMGMDSWPLWVKKISSFTASPHVNHISLLTVVAGSEGRQAEVLAQRSFVFWALVALYFFLAVWIGARSRPHRVAILGIMMMPVIMYPANYYIHFVFLLPLLASDPLRVDERYEKEASGKAWAILLAICVAQYFTVRESDLAIHFYNASVILMAGLLGVLIALLPRDTEGRIDFESLPFVRR